MGQLTEGARLLTRQAILAAIVESSCDAIFSEDLDGTIATWNGGAEELFGYTEAEAVGKRASLIVPVDRTAEAEMLLTCARQGRQLPPHQTIRLCKNRAAVEVALTLSPVRDGSGRLVGVSTIARDNAEQRWMAKTLDALISKLEVALAQAQQSEDRVRRFLADAAHQLRSPLTGIAVCADAALREPGVAAEPTELLEKVLQESSRAGRLVTSLLEMARLQHPEGLILEPCDIVALCDAAVQRAATLAPGLEVHLHTRPLTEPVPVLDARAVHEMITNLLDNALRHAKTRVRVVVDQDGSYLEIRVVDDGPGMSPEVAERAFERFATLDGLGGTGLGLPIAREAARAHAGELSYDGRERGFVARLPLRSATPASPRT